MTSNPRPGWSSQPTSKSGNERQMEGNLDKRSLAINSSHPQYKDSQMRETKVTKKPKTFLLKKKEKKKKKQAFAVKMMGIICVHHSQFMYVYKKNPHHKMLVFKYIHHLHLHDLAFSSFLFLK